MTMGVICGVPAAATTFTRFFTMDPATGVESVCVLCAPWPTILPPTMDYLYTLGAWILIIAIGRAENTPGNSSKTDLKLPQTRQVDFINEFLVSSSGSVSNINTILPPDKNNNNDTKLTESPKLSNNKTLENKIIPVPSAASSAIDTVPIHPRIPRRSLTRRKTKVRRLNRQGMRKVYFAQPARILLPPFRQEEPSTSEKPEESSKNFNNRKKVNLQRFIDRDQIVDTTTERISEPEQPGENESSKKLTPQRKVYVPPPPRFLLPPVLSENTETSQFQIPPSPQMNETNAPTNSENESHLSNTETRPVSRLPILIIENVPTEYPEINGQGFSNEPKREVEILNAVQSSRFRNQLLISVTTEITPINFTPLSSGNFDRNSGERQECNHEQNKHIFSATQTQHLPSEDHEQNTNNNPPNQVQQVVPQNQINNFPQQAQNENQPDFAPNTTRFTNRHRKDQLQIVPQNIDYVNRNGFDSNQPQHFNLNEKLQQNQQFPTVQLPQQNLPENIPQGQTHLQSSHNHKVPVESQLQNQQNIFNQIQPQVTNGNQVRPPINHLTEETHFDIQQSVPAIFQDLSPPNLETFGTNPSQPQFNPQNQDNAPPNFSANLNQFSQNNQQGNFQNYQQQTDLSDNRYNQSNNAFPPSAPMISLELQPPFEESSYVEQANQNMNQLPIRNQVPTSWGFQPNQQTSPQVNQQGNNPEHNLSSDHGHPERFRKQDNTFRNHSRPSDNNYSGPTTPASQFSPAPVLLQGPNIEQALFETGDFHIFDAPTNDSDDVTLSMMDKPLLTQDIFDSGMKIMAMNKEKFNKMKVYRGKIKYKNLGQFDLFSDRFSAKNGAPTKLVVAETSYYNVPRGAVELYQDSEIRVIPGQPGRDYPTLNAPPPESDFSCRSVDNHRGYVADPTTRCQVFYICVGAGPGEPMLCPNGTLFSQDFLVCDWWYNIDCQPYT